MIQLQLHKTFRSSQSNFSLDVECTFQKGQFITLYGDSGAGKTSILRLIAGLSTADEGNINVNDNNWFSAANKFSLPPQKRKIGYVFQDSALFPNMSVRKNIEFALEKGKDKTIVNEVIQLIELKELEDRFPETLSGGQKQRVALARAIVNHPDILLLDEPLSALDDTMRQKLQDFILKAHKQYNLTTIMVSHDIGEIIKMSDTTFCIENGKITNQGNPLEIFTENKISAKFQLTGEILKIEKEDVVFVVTIIIGNNIIKTIAQETEVMNLAIGDKVIVASKAFNPILIKINK